MFLHSWPPTRISPVLGMPGNVHKHKYNQTRNRHSPARTENGTRDLGSWSACHLAAAVAPKLPLTPENINYFTTLHNIIRKACSYIITIYAPCLFILSSRTGIDYVLNRTEQNTYWWEQTNTYKALSSSTKRYSKSWRRTT